MLFFMCLHVKPGGAKSIGQVDVLERISKSPKTKTVTERFARFRERLLVSSEKKNVRNETKAQELETADRNHCHNRRLTR